MRSIGMDVHRDFCEVAIVEDGRLRSAGRVAASPEALERSPRSLEADDQVALEATGNALAIARIVEPHVARVVLPTPKAVHAARRAGAKTDRIDARTPGPAAGGRVRAEVWLPDEATRAAPAAVARRARPGAPAHP